MVTVSACVSLGAGMSGHSPDSGDLFYVDDATVDEWLAGQDGLSAVFVTAAWCAQSQEVRPIMEEFAAERPIAMIDFDASPRFKATFDVAGVPSVLMFRRGELAARYTKCTQVVEEAADEDSD